jgi:fatty acid desaturase
MTKFKQIEWPSLFLAVAIYAGWGSLTFFHTSLPAWLVVALGSWLIAWHSSLQHEIVHGHPTPWQGVNTLLAFPPLSLWLPFHVYRASHLEHHRAESLTDPQGDPESYYWASDTWSELNPVVRTIVRLQTSLLGRLLIGPAWNAFLMGMREISAIRRQPRRGLLNLALHVFACAVVLVWIVAICKMSPWFYLFAIVYPGTALSLVRSFAEHKAARAEGEETAIVENARILGLLFLFNNLHVVHHSRPDLPWYRIPGWYKQHRDRLLSQESIRVYRGYGEIARRYLLNAFDDPVHPLSYE